MTTIALAIPTEEIIYYFGLIGMFFIGIIIYRLGSKEAWYFYIDKDERGIYRIPKEAEKFNKEFGSDEYVSSYAWRGAYAIIWFFLTFLITIMAVVGGSTITDANPNFKLPCIILILIMQMITLSKPVFLVAEFVEDWVFKCLALLYISTKYKREPMAFQFTKYRSSVNKKRITEIKPSEEVPENV